MNWAAREKKEKVMKLIIEMKVTRCLRSRKITAAKRRISNMKKKSREITNSNQSLTSTQNS